MPIDLILIEASPGETRVAALADGTVWRLGFHRDIAPSLVGALFVGQVRRVEPALGAAFVNLGLESDGFLRARDIGRGAGGGKRARIERLVQEGVVLAVRVTADGRGGKGPTLTIAEAGEWDASEARREAPACLDPGPEPVARLLGDCAGDSVTKIITGDHRSAAAARRWAAEFLPAVCDSIEVWSGTEPLFEAHGVEAEIEAALAPLVSLPGGGELVFEPGETLTAIDVNSAGFAGKAARAARDLNLALAPELARQISLRNIAGAIVVDLLRMEAPGDRNAVLRAMRGELAGAPVGCDVLGISRLGLLELTRRRRGPSLGELMLGPSTPASLRADAAAYAALRRVMATARPGAGVTLAAAPAVVAELEGPLADALADAARIAGTIRLAAEPGWPHDRAEVIFGDGA